MPHHPQPPVPTEGNAATLLTDAKIFSPKHAAMFGCGAAAGRSRGSAHKCLCLSILFGGVADICAGNCSESGGCDRTACRTPTSRVAFATCRRPLPHGKFAVVEVLKGADLVEEAGLLGINAKPITTITLEEKPVGTLFLLMGIEPPELIWSSPIPVSTKAVAYLKKLPELAEKGPDRLAFFQQYLEDADESLARDAYDEFAVAPYVDVRGLESRMDSTQLLAWIENPKIQSSRRRLYATMLGVCGTKADAERIEAILIGNDLAGDSGKEDRAELRSGLDALIACSVTLRGADGLDLIDTHFLDRKGRDVPFTETYAAVMALRFLGEESDAVPRDRVLESLHPAGRTQARRSRDRRLSKMAGLVGH